MFEVIVASCAALRWLLDLYCIPEILINLKLIKVRARVARATTKEVNRFSLCQEHMGVSWRRNEHAGEINQCPSLFHEIEEVKIIELPRTIMASKQVEFLS